MIPLDSPDTPLLAHTIQLAIAPVFLLTAIGSFLSVITARLGRVIDRARLLEKALMDGDSWRDEAHREASLAELASLDRRIVLANRAVGLSVSSALTVCALVTTLFLNAVSSLHPHQIVAPLFILALLLLMAALLSFALEIRISIRTVRVRAELLHNVPRPPGDIRFPR